ncbi:DUF418 domain-containing protein [Nonomuraea sp. NPDC050643]|uniref:DUF418 domain-containing protein n=1 Tax=Nonomuraea sp. NPDC050643 TaxID=3155660 RepID=UPI0033D9F5DD
MASPTRQEHVAAPPRERITALDVLRGIAILGTFGTNVWLFAQPGGPAAWFADVLKPAASAAEWAESGLLALANGKFLAMLTVLFGVGIELQYQAARRRGAPWAGRYPVRAAILFAEGLVHYLLVFEGDVLMSYAITSLLVAYLVGRSDRAVRAWIWVLGTLSAVSIALVTALLTTLPEQTGTAPYDPAATASWVDQVVHRFTDAGAYRLETLMILPSSVVLFLIGSRLVRAGAFGDSEPGARIRRRLTLWGLGLGLPLNVLVWLAGPDFFLVERYLVPPLIALGLLALVTTWTLRARGGPTRRGLTAVGRTALSCYVLQNLLAGIVCYGWGLGLAERLAGFRPWWVPVLWAVVSLVNVAAATLWLRRFDRGPLELLMHRMRGA